MLRYQQFSGHFWNRRRGVKLLIRRGSRQGHRFGERVARERFCDSLSASGQGIVAQEARDRGVLFFGANRGTSVPLLVEMRGNGAPRSVKSETGGRHLQASASQLTLMSFSFQISAPGVLGGGFFLHHHNAQSFARGRRESIVRVASAAADHSLPFLGRGPARGNPDHARLGLGAHFRRDGRAGRGAFRHVR